MTVYSQGVNQSRSGTDKVNAIINCHLATGRIGQPGAGPFSVTGQPNAMGGREVGGLANTLAAHIDFDDPIGMQTVRDFWQAPNLAASPGLKAVELFEAAREGKIKALWIMATNPSVSMPATTKVRQALAKCPFVVVSDVVRQSDTAAFADVLLPALGWGEKDGTVTNSERCISRQRALQPGPVGAKADWWIISAVARRMGYIDAFSYQNPAEIFAEYAAMTTLDSKKPRALNLANLVGISEKSYDELAPQIWPSEAEHSDFRLFANGRFSTVDQRARFVATEWRETGSVTDDNYPLALTSGRVRDQWHTMTRTGLVPRLAGHIAEPFIEIHPQDAAKYNIEPASSVELREHNSRPPILVRALITSRVAAGCCFVPMHFSAQQTSAGLVNDVFTGFTDPISGQPELKHSAISVRPFAASWYAFAISRSRPADPSVAYWARMRAASGWRLEMAGHEEVEFEQLFATLAGPLAAGTATHRV